MKFQFSQKKKQNFPNCFSISPRCSEEFYFFGRGSKTFLESRLHHQLSILMKKSIQIPINLSVDLRCSVNILAIRDFFNSFRKKTFFIAQLKTKLKWLLNNELPLLPHLVHSTDKFISPFKSYLLERVCRCSRVYDDECVYT